MAIDLSYSAKVGLIKNTTSERCLILLEKLGFRLFDDWLTIKGRQESPAILDGLEEFREHLGGELTITLLQGIGEGVEVHAMDRQKILQSVEDLQTRELVKKRL